jgi:hypothetical protein
MRLSLTRISILISSVGQIKQRVRIICGIGLFMAIFCFAVLAETAPSIAWKKKLPSDCYFVTTTGDSIVCVGKTIMVLSQDGSILSQSPSLEDTKTISSNPPTFFFTNDHSFIMVKDKCTIKKISLNGEIVWTKSFCDSIPGAVFTDFTEDASGTAYLCGTVSHSAGLIAKIGNNGSYARVMDSSMLPVFSSIMNARDSLYVVAKHYQNLNGGGSLNLFDNKEVFVKRLIDTGCGSPMIIDGGHIFSLSVQDGSPWLFKRTFSSTADIVVKKHSINGKLDTTIVFDFGKYEYPLSLQKYREGILMITISDETVNMGTNYLNYFISKLDVSLKKQWQLRFGTDTMGLGGNGNQYRYFSVNEAGMILATHNDTIFKFVDASTAMQPFRFQRREKNSGFSEKTVKVFDLQGRFLFNYPVGIGLDAHQLKRLRAAPGLKLLRSVSGSEGEMKVFYLK